jgi:hypothetical protein
MKVALLFADRRFDARANPPETSATLVEDLGLNILFAAMADGDKLIADIVPRVVLDPLDSPAAMRYRQAAISDCIERPAVVRELYAVAVETLDAHRRVWGLTTIAPSSVLYWAGDSLRLFIGSLRRLREIAVEHGAEFRSEAFSRLFAEMGADLGEGYLREIEEHVRRLRFDDGMTLRAVLGPGNRGTGYTLRRPVRRPGWRARMGLPEKGTYVYQLHPRDEAGAQMLGDIRAQGTALAAAALGRSADHIASYFTQLRAELAFYVGCLNLHDRLRSLDQPTCLPDPEPVGSRALDGRGLYDACLALASGERVVSNDVAADGKLLIMVTGANRGGKSTFVRSLGLAQLLMQAGMFVPGAAFRADVRIGIMSHFKREEDTGLRSGKLDEELGRMSWIVDHAGPASLILMNESFASTNEREGSEIGRQVVGALLDAGIRVAYVTHLFDLASGFHDSHRDDALFLRAERLPDGRRSYRVVPGEPLPTSHGQDIYRRVFEAGRTAPRATAAARVATPGAATSSGA